MGIINRAQAAVNRVLCIGEYEVAVSARQKGGRDEVSEVREPVNQGFNMLQVRNLHIPAGFYADSKAGRVCTGGKQNQNWDV